MQKSIISALMLICVASITVCDQSLAGSDETVAKEANKAQQPNIVFILADDLGYGHLGSYGQDVIKTPMIDKLADSGLRFTQAYAGSTVCAPSRSVLMTGQHTGHTTVRANFGADRERIPLAEADVTVAEVLKLKGKVEVVAPGTLPKDGLVIEDQRTYD